MKSCFINLSQKRFIFAPARIYQARRLKNGATAPTRA